MISIQNIKKQYGRKILFDNASASFTDQQRVGLIGANGTGKTSLLRIIMGTELPDSGTVSVPTSQTIGYLPQEVEVLAERTPLEIVLEPFAHLMDVEKAYDAIIMPTGDASDEDYRKAMDKIEKLQRDIDHHDVFSLDSRAKTILAGLGVPADTWNKPIAVLSGGYRMRVVLGRLLLSQPDVLLLDEPTNHLDIDSLFWLEKFLERFAGMLIVVSHDREFLNRMTNCTAEIRNGIITMFRGNYDAFVVYKEERDASVINTSKNLERKIAQTERFIERFRSKASKATLVQSRVKQCESLKEDLPVLPEHIKTIHFRFPLSRSSGGVPFKLEHVTAGYNPGLPVFSDVNITITRGDKIAIIGPNGAGKTTLLKVLAQALKPEDGSVRIGHNVDLRYYSQHVLDQLDPERTLYETIGAASGSGERSFIQNVLGAFLFSGEDVLKRTAVLSGGEKSRLSLASILAQPGNVLVLDEPTNHLDIQSIDILAEALEQFEGTVILVSHNEYFISRIANRIIEMRPGKVRDFPGTITEYHDLLAAGYSVNPNDEGNAKTAPKVQKIDDKQQRMKAREERKQIVRKNEKIERGIKRCEKDIEECNSLLRDPANVAEFDLLSATMKRLETVNAEYEQLLNDWELSQEQLKSLESYCGA